MGYQILVISFAVGMAGCNSQDSKPHSVAEALIPSTPVSSPVEPAVADSEPEVVDSEPEVSTTNLSADDAFTFSNQQSVLLDINLPELSEERTAVNVCYPAEDGSIDRGNCLLQSSLQEGALVAELSPGAHQTSLLMEIWDFSDLSGPMSYSWSYSDGQNWFIR